MQITKDKIITCMRAIVTLKDLADIALAQNRQSMALETKQDLLVLVRIIRQLEAEAMEAAS